MNELPQTDWWRTLLPLTPRYGALKVFTDFVQMSSYAVHHPNREPEFVALAQSYPAEDFTLFGQAFGQLLFERFLHPFTDTLGPTYLALLAESGAELPATGFPPQPLAELLSMMTFSDELYRDTPSDEPITLTDPACGAGVMLMSAAQVASKTGKFHRLFVHAADSNLLATQMALVNLSLAQVRASVRHQDPAKPDEYVEWFTNTKLLSTLLGPVENVLSTLAPNKGVQP